MSVPPLRLYNNFETFFSGEVIVHASAVIAPGVIMQAAPNSKIIIGSGVCIGMGSILQVDTGTLEIESGANLGSGFLMVGAGKIGANACIGSATTVFCASLEAGTVVAAGSVIGDNSRSLRETSTPEINGRVKQPQLPAAEEVEATQEIEQEEIQQAEIQQEEIEQEKIEQAEIEQAEIEQEEIEQAEPESISNAPTNPTYTTPPVTPSPRPYVSPSPISYFPTVKDSTEETVLSEDSIEEVINKESIKEPNSNSNGVGNHIYGRTNIKSLLITLFPHRQSLDKPLSDDESKEG